MKQQKLCPKCGYGIIKLIDDVPTCDHCQTEFEELE